MVQLMLLPPHHFFLIKMQNGSAYLLIQVVVEDRLLNRSSSCLYSIASVFAYYQLFLGKTFIVEVMSLQYVLTNMWHNKNSESFIANSYCCD